MWTKSRWTTSKRSLISKEPLVCRTAAAFRLDIKCLWRGKACVKVPPPSGCLRLHQAFRFCILLLVFVFVFLSAEWLNIFSCFSLVLSSYEFTNDCLCICLFFLPSRRFTEYRTLSCWGGGVRAWACTELRKCAEEQVEERKGKGITGRRKERKNENR